MKLPQGYSKFRTFWTQNMRQFGICCCCCCFFFGQYKLYTVPIRKRQATKFTNAYHKIYSRPGGHKQLQTSIKYDILFKTSFLSAKFAKSFSS